MFYLEFISSSKKHLLWIQSRLCDLLGVGGRIGKSYSGTFQLKYAKEESKKIIRRMYLSKNSPMLERKCKKVYNALVIDKNNR